MKYFQDKAEEFINSINEQVGAVIIDEINKKINLDKIIQDDQNKRKLDFDTAYNDCKDEDLRNAMVYEEFKFNSTEEKLAYATQALLDNWFTLAYNVTIKWIVEIKFYVLDSVSNYFISTSSNVICEEIQK